MILRVLVYCAVRQDPFSPEDPHESISTKFGTASCLADLITHDNFF